MSRRAGLGLAVILALGLARPTSAYVILYDQWGYPRTWHGGTVPWALAASGSQDVPITQIEAALKSAFSSWQSIPCATVSFSYQGKTSTNPSQGIFVRWLDQSWDLTTADAAGVTTNWVLNGPNGGIKKVEIYFNGVNFTWTTAGADDPFSDLVDVEAVAAHEIGHAIGLDHSRHRQATMYFTAFPGESEAQRSLEPDDTAGACFLYPSTAFSGGMACDACAQHSQCASGACMDFGGDEGGFCGQACSATASCPTGFTCYQIQGVGDPQCLPDNDHCAPIGANIAVGEYCYGHETCNSGHCLVLPDSAVCTKACTPGGASNGGCPADMACLGQAGNAVCFPKGDGPLGSSCVSSADCQSFSCVGLGDNQGVCTQSCAAGAGCPGGFACVLGYCIHKGSKGFGEPCAIGPDCASAICGLSGSCTQECTQDADCPGESTCGAAGLCAPGPTGTAGDACGPGAETCVSSLFCFYETADASAGTCRTKCDARFDSGCPEGLLCQWVYQDWFQKVVGVCTPDNGGGQPGDSCGGSAVCQPHLVCADTDGTGAHCRYDCNANNTLGCSAGSTCVPLNLPDDPKKGACHPPGAQPPVEQAQQAEPAAPAAEAPSAAEEVGGGSDAAGGTGGGEDAGPGALGQSDAGVTPGGGTTGGSGASGAGSAAPSAGAASGGCSHAPPARHAATLALMVLLALAGLRRRRCLHRA